jgi:hypothetical protein
VAVVPSPPPRAVPGPATVPGPAPAPAAAGQAADGNLEAGWARILDALPLKVKGYYREARPEREGDIFRLWFPYMFHFNQAQDSKAEVEPRIRAWLGEGTRIELHLKEEQRAVSGAAPTRRMVVPEDDPAVQQAVRKLEGRVVRVTGRPDR